MVNWQRVTPDTVFEEVPYIFIWEHDVWTGWPLTNKLDDDGCPIWETAEFAHQLYGVQWYAPKPELPKEV